MACWLVGLWFSAGGVVGAADECEAYYCTANCDQWSTKCTCEARFCDTYWGPLSEPKICQACLSPDNCCTYDAVGTYDDICYGPVASGCLLCNMREKLVDCPSAYSPCSGGACNTPAPTAEPTASPTTIPSCVVGFNGGVTNEIMEGESVSVTVSGNARSSAMETIWLYVERRDGGVMDPVPVNYNLITTPITAYAITGCSSKAANCSNTTSISLPVGEYYFHCEIPTTTGGKCSGDPFCSYENPFPGVSIPPGQSTCTGWKSCSATDHKYLAVTPHEVELPVVVYSDPTSLCTGTTLAGDDGYPGGTFSVENLSVVETPLIATGVSGSHTFTVNGRMGIPYKYGVSFVNSGPGSADWFLSPYCPSTYEVYVTDVLSPLGAREFYVTQSADPWFQILGGDAGSNGNLSAAIPANKTLMADNNLNSSGVALAAGVATVTGGTYGPINRNWSAGSSAFFLPPREGYTYFSRLYEMGSAPANGLAEVMDWDTEPYKTETNVTGGMENAYYRQGNLELSDSPPADFVKRTVFVDGDLTISSDIIVDIGDFLAFIVSGSITIGPNVSVVQGVYIADGQLRIEDGEGSGGYSFLDSPRQLEARGIFVGWSGVALERDLVSGSGGDETENNLYPASRFIYRPDFLVNAPAGLKRFSIGWQEVAPNRGSNQ